MPARTAATIQFLTAILAVVAFLFAGTHRAAGQDSHDFAVTIDPIRGCGIDATISGTVTFTGLSTGFGFYVQLRGDGVILDGQAFEGHDGYPNGTYDWHVSGDLSGMYEHVDLYFAFSDGELDLIREETHSIDGLCDPEATPAGISGLPIAGAGRVFTEDRVEMLAFVAVILGVLAVLTVLDRQKGR
jgi:hypothetical protein